MLLTHTHTVSSFVFSLFLYSSNLLFLYSSIPLFLCSCIPPQCVQRAAVAVIAALGAQYEKEHPDDVKDRKQLGVDGRRTVNYGGKLPAPFENGRPKLGERLFVRANCRRFIPPLLKEMQDWRHANRHSAAALLRTLMVYLEEHMTQYVSTHPYIHTHKASTHPCTRHALFE